jgi:hypothetical protein
MTLTIGEQIKAARAELETARTTVGIAISASLDASKSVKGEAEKLKAEAAAMLAELAEVTNGGPAIDDAPAAVLPASFP